MDSLTLPSPPSLEVTLVPAATSPTLPESSMSPRGLLRLRLMPRLTPPSSTPPTATDSHPMLDTTDWLTTDLLGIPTPTTTGSDPLTTPPPLLLLPLSLPPPLLPQLLLPPWPPATARSAPPPP